MTGMECDLTDLVPGDFINFSSSNLLIVLFLSSNQINAVSKTYCVTFLGSNSTEILLGLLVFLLASLSFGSLLVQSSLSGLV